MGTIKTTNIEPIADNGTVTLGSSGDQFTLATGAKSSFLYPAFEAQLSGTQNITDGTTTKVQLDTENFDTDNCYDNSTNYRFTPNVAGKYFVYNRVYVDTSGSGDCRLVIGYVYKNGTKIVESVLNFHSTANGEGGSVTGTIVVDMNGSTDYLETFGYGDSVSGNNLQLLGGTDNRNIFGAYRIGS